MTHHQEPALDTVYGAIADPTRRALLALLKEPNQVEGHRNGWTAILGKLESNCG